MRVAVYLALGAALVASVLLPRAARRLAPRPATLVLVLGGLVAAGVWVGSVGLLAASVVGRLGLAGYVGHWSPGVFASRQPVPPVVGFVGAVLLAAAVLTVSYASRDLVAEVARLHRMHRDAAPARWGDVAVVEASVPEAVALPGWRGSIVLTTAMLQALEPAERRVLLAHERSHLRHRHWVFRLGIRLAAALLPTLRPTVRQCDRTIERWADEDAADVVGDRRLVAAAVAKAALAGAAAERTALVAGFSDGAVVARVEALLAEPAPSRWGALVLPSGALLTAAVAAVAAASRLEDVFELARHL